MEVSVLLGIILVISLHLRLIHILKARDPELWANAGRPNYFNSEGNFGIVYFTLSNKHKKSISTEVINTGNWHRYTFISVIIIVFVYLVVPLEVWYGQL